MDTLASIYLDHFDQYGCRFYKVPAEARFSGSAKDREWLEEIGLPDSAIPFFYFDTLIADLRDVEYNAGELILGTAFHAVSRDYVLINREGQVILRFESEGEIIINSSLRQFCRALLTYSEWLEEHEDAYAQDPDHIIEDQDVFELYYNLRNIDNEAMNSKSSLWPQVLNAELIMDGIDQPA